MIGSIRRECTDHVIVLNEAHLKNILCSYFAYYHNDRTYLRLEKDPPDSRPIQSRPAGESKIIALPQIGGLHHPYEWKKAAWKIQIVMRPSNNLCLSVPGNRLDQRVRPEIVCFKPWRWIIVFNHCTKHDVLRHICHVLIFAKDNTQESW